MGSRRLRVACAHVHSSADARLVGEFFFLSVSLSLLFSLLYYLFAVQHNMRKDFFLSLQSNQNVQTHIHKATPDNLTLGLCYRKKKNSVDVLVFSLQIQSHISETIPECQWVKELGAFTNRFPFSHLVESVTRTLLQYHSSPKYDG